MWNVVKTAEEIGGEVELTGQEAGLMNNWILDINDLDTENNIVLNKVKDQPGLTAINFDLLKSKTFLEFDSTIMQKLLRIQKRNQKQYNFKLNLIKIQINGN